MHAIDTEFWSKQIQAISFLVGLALVAAAGLIQKVLAITQIVRANEDAQRETNKQVSDLKSAQGEQAGKTGVIVDRLNAQSQHIQSNTAAVIGLAKSMPPTPPAGPTIATDAPQATIETSVTLDYAAPAVAALHPWGDTNPAVGVYAPTEPAHVPVEIDDPEPMPPAITQSAEPARPVVDGVNQE